MLVFQNGALKLFSDKYPFLNYPPRPRQNLVNINKMYHETLLLTVPGETNTSQWYRNL
jgi:hypothetical protein